MSFIMIKNVNYNSKQIYIFYFSYYSLTQRVESSQFPEQCFGLDHFRHVPTYVDEVSESCLCLTVYVNFSYWIEILLSNTKNSLNLNWIFNNDQFKINIVLNCSYTTFIIYIIGKQSKSFTDKVAVPETKLQESILRRAFYFTIIIIAPRYLQQSFP